MGDEVVAAIAGSGDCTSIFQPAAVAAVVAATFKNVLRLLSTVLTGGVRDSEDGGVSAALTRGSSMVNDDTHQKVNANRQSQSIADGNDDDDDATEEEGAITAILIGLNTGQ